MEHRTKLPPNMPNRMKGLKRDSAGRPVPFFVEWIDGVPDFRIMSAKNYRRAIMESLCWVCGSRLLKHQGRPIGSFVAGPMCLVNRTSAEPPAHADCAEWSAKACPFLNNPAKVRREGHMPEGVSLENQAGIMIARNPGVTAVIESERWSHYRDGGGILFTFTPSKVDFFTNGLPATADQIMHSIETGLPALHELALQEDGAKPALARALTSALYWLPSGVDINDWPLVSKIINA